MPGIGDENSLTYYSRGRRAALERAIMVMGRRGMNKCTTGPRGAGRLLVNQRDAYLGPVLGGYVPGLLIEVHADTNTQRPF